LAQDMKDDPQVMAEVVPMMLGGAGAADPATAEGNMATAAGYPGRSDPVMRRRMRTSR